MAPLYTSLIRSKGGEVNFMSKTSKRILSTLGAVVTVLGFAAGVTFAQTSSPSPTQTTTPTPTMTQSVQGESTVPAGAPSTGRGL